MKPSGTVPILSRPFKMSSFDNCARGAAAAKGEPIIKIFTASIFLNDPKRHPYG